MNNYAIQTHNKEQTIIC